MIGPQISEQVSIRWRLLPCEVPSVRERLRQSLGLAGRPVLLIRLGYAEAMPASYRRPLADVIRESGDPS